MTALLQQIIQSSVLRIHLRAANGVEHHIDLVVDLCDRICVLNLGKVLKIDVPHVIQNDEEVIQSYLGSRKEQSDEQ